MTVFAGPCFFTGPWKSIVNPKQDSSYVCVQGEPNNRQFCLGLLCSLVFWIGYYVLIASPSINWAIYPLAAIHVVTIIIVYIKRPRNCVFIGKESIAWFSDGILWPSGKLVSWIELTKVELSVEGKRESILLHSRYSPTKTINDSCFDDATKVMDAIREQRPDLVDQSDKAAEGS